jgi:hypothetical protein
MKKLLVLLSYLAIAVLARPVNGQEAVNVAGTWNLTLETPQGTGTPTLVLQQAGETLTGTYAGRMGEMPVTGTIKGTAITYSVKINAQGQELELVFSGTVEPSDSMKGTVDFGGMGSANWSGSRKK